MLLRTTPRQWAALFCLVLAIGIAPLPAQSQIISDGSSQIFDPTQVNPLLLLRQRLSQGSLAAPAIPLEGAVDEDDYVVGPGDSFIFSVNGQDAVGAPAVVGADGRITLPDAGLLLIGGKTLRNARSEMMTALEISFANSAIEIGLAGTRQFYVHVAGAVPTPGRYLAIPVARVSNVLEFAFADTTNLPVTNSVFRPSLRNVEVRRTDGSIANVDLVRYFSTGDTDANPYLRDGDVIFVPAHNPDYSSISVGGYIPYPGTYDFRDGDHLLDVLRVAGGLRAEDGAESVRVSRATETGLETFSFTVDQAIGEDGAGFEIHALDVISVAEKSLRQGMVRVEGHVNFPGSYPIIDGVTTLSEIVEASGGLREDALARGAFLERRSLPDPSLTFVPDRYGDQEEALQRRLQADTTAILQRLRLTDLDFLSRSYFAQELRIQNRVSVNLESSLDGGSDPVLLRSGDRLVVPQDLNTIFVFGQVNQPGYVTVESGMSAEYYIGKAGGRSIWAKEVLILNPATGSFTVNLSQAMMSGDVIFVDRVVDVADSAEMQRLVIESARVHSDARIRTMQTILQSVGTLASVVALVISIRRK